MKYAIKLVADGYDLKQVRRVLDVNTAVLKTYESKLKMFCDAIRSIQTGESPAKIREDCEKWILAATRSRR